MSTSFYYEFASFCIFWLPIVCLSDMEGYKLKIVRVDVCYVLGVMFVIKIKLFILLN